MSDPTTPSAIAARLTPRQKAALMWLPADGSGKELWTAGQLGPAVRGLRFRVTPLAAHRWGSVSDGSSSLIYYLNERGRRVREVVAAEQQP